MFNEKNIKRSRKYTNKTLFLFEYQRQNKNRDKNNT